MSNHSREPHYLRLSPPENDSRVEATAPLGAPASLPASPPRHPKPPPAPFYHPSSDGASFPEERIVSTLRRQLTRSYFKRRIHPITRRPGVRADERPARFEPFGGSRIKSEVLKEKRAEYGAEIVVTLSQQLAVELGDELGENNLCRMIQLAEAFPDDGIVVTMSRQLPPEKVSEQKLQNAVGLAQERIVNHPGRDRVSRKRDR